MRLIDKDAYEKRMQEVYCKPCEADKKDHYGVACRACWVDDAMASVETMPEVDAEPVVRCRDCKRWNNSERYYRLCDRLNICGQRPEDYCSYGERKGGAEHE